MASERSYPSQHGEYLDQHLSAARAGDSQAFAHLSEPYRRELTSHCYRMLGSLLDAEDMVQETYLRAWRRLETYNNLAPFRTWLYKIATNACLDLIDRRPKRSLPVEKGPPSDPTVPLQPPSTEPLWIEPFPDELLAPAQISPETRYESSESISLAFLVVLQDLPARQRCALILGDVLDWNAEEIAGVLDATVSAVNSLLHRARATMKQRYRAGPAQIPFATSEDHQLRKTVERYLHAWENADIEGIVSMLTEEATFPMPPLPVWYQGRSAIRTFLSTTILAGKAKGRWRLLPIRANALPGFAFYRLDETKQQYEPYAIQVLNFEGYLVCDVTTFGYPSLFPVFKLPGAIAA
jgi:RNA polymerase sigma-70 factor (ECF subfamily)